MSIDHERAENESPRNHVVAAGAGTRAHNRDRTGDLILTKDVLCRLSYVSDLHATVVTPRITSVANP